VSCFLAVGQNDGILKRGGPGQQNTQAMILGVPARHSMFLVACHLVHVLYYREMKTDREMEILFRRLRLYDELSRHAEGLIRTIQRA
jgi:hypothetical protein